MDVGYNVPYKWRWTMTGCYGDVYKDFKDLRTAWFSAQLLVAYKFSTEGFLISMPFVFAPYDLIADNGSRLLRIQVKRASLKTRRMRAKGWGDSERYSVELTRKSAQRPKKRIEASEFDYLCVVCELDKVYVIPAEKIKGPTGSVVRNLSIRASNESARKDRILSWERFAPYLNNFNVA
jgi:hypothetical protein